jgi:putative ABC transport system permease protein
MREFGGVEQSKESCRDARGVNLIEDLIEDVRHGARVLRKNLGFTVVAVFTLGLGIGANTAIFSVVNTVMLRPFPYPDADRLVLLNETAENRGRLEMMSVSWQDYLDWRQQARSFQYLGIFRGQNLTLTGFDQAERLNGRWPPQTFSMPWVFSRRWAARLSRRKTRRESLRRQFSANGCGVTASLRHLTSSTGRLRWMA